MKKVFALCEKGFKNAECVGKVDVNGENVSKSLLEVDSKADVVIDFSFHTVVGDLLEYAVKNNIPTVIATTGHTKEEKAKI